MPARPRRPPPSPPRPLKVEDAQAALKDAASRLRDLARRLEETHDRLPEPPDINDRQEGRKPYDRTTEILATIECVLEDDLHPAIEVLQRAANVTDAELRTEYRKRPAWRQPL